jgi:predicted nucleic acid-binding protein
MLVVVADTGPLNYLVQIDAIELLPTLFGNIIVPAAVRDELVHRLAPVAVRGWAELHPPWLEVKPNPIAQVILPRYRPWMRASAPQLRSRATSALI